MKRIYLDNAATTAMRSEVVDEMARVMRDHFGNPSSIHSEGRQSRSLIEKARKTIAKAIGASIGEIFFTSGGTESNNMALKCAVRDLGVQRIISSPTEHHCITNTLDCLETESSISVNYLNVDKRGRLRMNELEKLFKEYANEKLLLSLMHSNNEIGTMIDLEAIGALCQTYDVLLLTDTVQTIGYFPIDVSKLNIQFLSGSAHKFHGPKGVGFIYINSQHPIRPFIDGGSQERNMRGGTENIYGIVGLAKALSLSIENMAQTRAHIEHLRNHLIGRLLAEFEDIHFNGDYKGRYHYKVLNVSFPPSPKSELLLFNLDIAGISASGGSACSSGAEAGSHVLKAIQHPAERKAIRFSFSHQNTIEEVDKLIEKLKAIIPAKGVMS